MLEYKILLGYIATIIALIGYVPYFRDIFRGKTKPHAFSWIIWGLLTTIGFFAQVVKQGGAGSWVTGFSALICFIIAGIAFFKGTREFVMFDWIALICSLVAIYLWWLTNDPALAVILISIADAIAFLPTFRKGYSKPYEETATTYALSGLKFIVALFALQSLSFSTWFYITSLIFMNSLFVVMLLVRRKQLKETF